jgi:hypothetical protein
MIQPPQVDKLKEVAAYAAALDKLVAEGYQPLMICFAKGNSSKDVVIVNTQVAIDTANLSIKIMNAIIPGFPITAGELALHANAGLFLQSIARAADSVGDGDGVKMEEEILSVKKSPFTGGNN